MHRPFTRPPARARVAPRPAATLLVALLGLAALPAVTAHAQDGGGTEQPERQRYDIAPGPLSEALPRFADQAGLVLSADAELTAGKDSPGLEGEYTIEQGLRRVLAGSGLDYRMTEAGTVRLVERRSDRLRAITVEGAAESAYGPVEGYKAERSAVGTRIDVPIMDTPASVQVVPREVIEDQRNDDLRDILRNVSGIQEDDTQGNRVPGFTIRGFDSGSQESQIARDGFLAPLFGFPSTANIERVDVLKGPSSVLFGRTSPGGMVNIITKKPQPERSTEIETAFGGGRFDDNDFADARIDVNQPLNASGTVLGRLNASYEDAGSFRNFFKDSERTQIAPTLRFSPSERTTLDLELDYNHQERQFDRGIVVVDGDPLALPRDRFIGEAFSTFESESIRASTTLDHEFNDVWSVRARYSFQHTDSDRLSADPRGLQADGRTMNRRVSDLRGERDSHNVQVNVLADFEALGVGHQALIGADYRNDELDTALDRASLDGIDIFNPEFGAQPGEFSFVSAQDRKRDSTAFYLQDLISIGERWKVLLGLRYDDFETDVTRSDGRVDADNDDSEISPRAGIVFQPRPDISLYANYTESFEPQLFEPSVEDSLDPLESEQIEVGIKKEWLDGRLATTLAAFEIEKSNIAVDDPDGDFQIQIGEQRSRGVELDISGKLTPQWRVIASAAYLDAEVTEDERFTEGNQLPNAAEWTGSLWSVYDFSAAPVRGLSVGGGIFGVAGDRAGDLDNTIDLDGFQRVDLFARYQAAENIELQLNIDNVFDDEFVRASGGNATRIEPGEPRQVFGSLKVTF